MFYIDASKTILVQFECMYALQNFS